ncbi:VOC family protein [Actinosynnema sp. CS-041913]|uniref:VOC family protein n=1 Tax=Actinosynnema sp. CS-041913 TaxID=3239917 RepID=UPI003D9089C0
MPTPGTPAWVEAPSGDLAASRDFYTGLFGWTYEVSPDPSFHGYTMAFHDGEPVAGLYPPPDEQAPPGWLLYLHTTDITETAKQVANLGAQPLMGPMEIPGAGHVLRSTPEETRTP